MLLTLTLKSLAVQPRESLRKHIDVRSTRLGPLSRERFLCSFVSRSGKSRISPLGEGVHDGAGRGETISLVILLRWTRIERSLFGLPRSRRSSGKLGNRVG